MNTNALAASIVLACRPRPDDAPVATRREFIDALKAELPEALRRMQQGNIAPVDLAQAAIGPGMAVFTRYARILDASGETVSVREALSLINQTLDEVLAEQEGDFDADTRWALAWFEQIGIQRRRLRRSRDPVQGQKHQRRGHGRFRHAQVARGQSPTALPRRAMPQDWDPGRRLPTLRLGIAPSPPSPDGPRRAGRSRCRSQARARCRGSA